MGTFISFVVIALVVLIVLSSCIKIVPQAQALVVERLGACLLYTSICITHLPQIAAMADSHFEIKKSVEEGRTVTRIRRCV